MPELAVAGNAYLTDGPVTFINYFTFRNRFNSDKIAEVSYASGYHPGS